MSTSQLVFGGVAFRVGSVGISINPEYELDGAGVPWLKHETWDLEIKLLKEFGDLDGQIDYLETLFSQPRDSISIVKNGVNSAHAIEKGESIGGVRPVRPPSYTRYQGGELVTYRSVSVSVQATIPLYTTPFHIVSFEETVNLLPAGKTKAALQPNVGDGVIQTVRTNQHSTLVQSGRIVYAGTYGDIPPPLIGNVKLQFNLNTGLTGTISNELLGPPEVSIRTPRKIGRGSLTGFVGFPIDYTYRFAAPTTMPGLPTKWQS